VAERWQVHYSTLPTTMGLDDVRQEMHVAQDGDGVEVGEVTDDRGDWRKVGQFLEVKAESPDEAKELATSWVDARVREFSQWRRESGLNNDEEFDPFDFFEIGEPQPLDEE
jgi:hypothetical protein